MTVETKPRFPLNIPGRIVMPYRYAAGAVGSRFLTELRDNCRIMGIRCPTCSAVYVPPRSTCIHCFEKLSEWVELSGVGTLQTFTIVNYSLPVHPLPPPFIYGIILLDGASTGITHFVNEITAEKLAVGIRLEAVFREKRQANILDIAYFKPV